MNERKLEKVWLPVFSGHGSSYRFDLEEYSSIQDRTRWLTYEEAEKQAKDWTSTSDTIGGHGEVIDMEKLLASDKNLEETYPFIRNF